MRHPPVPEVHRFVKGMPMRVRALVVAGLSAALLTACGGGSVDGTGTRAPSAPATATRTAPTGPELAAQAADALEQAGSARIQGSGHAEGQDVGLDLRLNGKDATGTVTLMGQQIELTVAGGAAYVRAPAAFWTAKGVPGPSAARLAGTWVRAPDAAASDLTEFNLAGLVDELRHPTDVTFDDRVTAGQVGGQPVWLLTDSDGSTTTVAAQGPPYPLQVSMTGVEHGELTLSEFGAVPPITAPAGAIDLDGRPA
jgi:hypothetical protein